jgi:hypothetical protein
MAVIGVAWLALAQGQTLNRGVYEQGTNTISGAKFFLNGLWIGTNAQVTVNSSTQLVSVVNGVTNLLGGSTISTNDILAIGDARWLLLGGTASVSTVSLGGWPTNIQTGSLAGVVYDLVRDGGAPTTGTSYATAPNVTGILTQLCNRANGGGTVYIPAGWFQVQHAILQQLHDVTILLSPLARVVMTNEAYVANYLTTPCLALENCTNITIRGEQDSAMFIGFNPLITTNSQAVTLGIGSMRYPGRTTNYNVRVESLTVSNWHFGVCFDNPTDGLIFDGLIVKNVGATNGTSDGNALCFNGRNIVVRGCLLDSPIANFLIEDWVTAAWPTNYNVVVSGNRFVDGLVQFGPAGEGSGGYTSMRRDYLVTGNQFESSANPGIARVVSVNFVGGQNASLVGNSFTYVTNAPVYAMQFGSVTNLVLSANRIRNSTSVGSGISFSGIYKNARVDGLITYGAGLNLGLSIGPAANLDFANCTFDGANITIPVSWDAPGSASNIWFSACKFLNANSGAPRGMQMNGPWNNINLDNCTFSGNSPDVQNYSTTNAFRFVGNIMPVGAVGLPGVLKTSDSTEYRVSSNLVVIGSASVTGTVTTAGGFVGPGTGLTNLNLVGSGGSTNITGGGTWTLSSGVWTYAPAFTGLNIQTNGATAHGNASALNFTTGPGLTRTVTSNSASTATLDLQLDNARTNYLAYVNSSNYVWTTYADTLLSNLWLITTINGVNVNTNTLPNR